MGSVFSALNPFGSSSRSTGGQTITPSVQTQTSYSGLAPTEKPDISKLLAEQLQTYAGRLGSYYSQPIPSTNAMGFFPEQMNAVDQLMSRYFGKTSSNYALQGMYNPQATSAVAGSALTQALPSLLQMIGQNIFMPEQIRAQRTGAVNPFLAQLIGALGTTGMTQATGAVQAAGQAPNPLLGLIGGLGTGIGYGLGGRGQTSAMEPFFQI